jgi:hypothetical protein
MSDPTLDRFASSLTPAPFDRTTVRDRRKVIEDKVTAETSSVGFIESGSWSHGTSIKGHSDVDYMSFIPESARPVLPSTALSRLKDTIAGAHWSIASTRISSPTVKVSFYQPPNFEIVPAYYKGKQDGIDVFRIPGPGDQWAESIPIAHNDFVNDVNDRLSKKVKTLARLVKAWKYQQEVPVSSFYLEMRTVKYASNESCIIYDIDLRRVFAELVLTEMRGMNDPLGIVPRIPATSSEANRIIAVRQAHAALGYLQAADAAQTSGNQLDYWSNMGAVFGYSDYPYPDW